MIERINLSARRFGITHLRDKPFAAVTTMPPAVQLRRMIRAAGEKMSFTKFTPGGCIIANLPDHLVKDYRVRIARKLKEAGYRFKSWPVRNGTFCRGWSR